MLPIAKTIQRKQNVAMLSAVIKALRHGTVAVILLKVHCNIPRNASDTDASRDSRAFPVLGRDGASATVRLSFMGKPMMIALGI